MGKERRAASTPPSKLLLRMDWAILTEEMPLRVELETPSREVPLRMELETPSGEAPHNASQDGVGNSIWRGALRMEL